MAIKNFNLDSATDLDNQKLPIQTVNGVSPDSNGNISVTSVTGNAGTATKLQTTRYLDGVGFTGAADVSHYGTCSTAADTVAKVVSCSNFALKTGSRIVIRFTVTNTASSPTLNVNGTGAKNICYRNSNITAGYLAANRTYQFVYDGTYYQLVGDLDTNTTYSKATNAEAVAGTNDTKFMTPLRTKESVLNFAPVKTVNSVSLDANGNISVPTYTHPSTHPASMITGLATVATSGSYNDLSNKPTIPATPKAYITTTWRSGTEWYRVWSDGWIEQGGYLSSTGKTVTFKKAFTTNQYTMAGVRNSTGGSEVSLVFHSKTTTSFYATSVWVGEGFSSTSCNWYACGY